VILIQDWDDDALHLANHHLQVGRDATLTYTAVTFGGEVVRIAPFAGFTAPGGTVTINGLYYADDGQHIEHRLLVDHSVPHCTSRILYKGALQGDATSALPDAHTVWVGDVLIRAAAEGTDTRNLVLTDGARADSVPNLEIETGEIAGAGHASAVGRFDEEHLFYLMSRGIPEDVARRLVVRGFFGEVINRIGVPEVRERITEAVELELHDRGPHPETTPEDFRRNASTTMTILEIKGLTARVAATDASAETVDILKGVDLTIESGQTHAIMGPNGSGKSTLAYVIAGHPKYEVTGGTVTLDGEDVLSMEVDERARAGLFLAMQYPTEIPGVSTANFLRTAATAVRGEAPKLRHWVKEVKEAMADLDFDPAFSERSVNEGFSGGEKKRHEILQLDLLKPRIAVLDETDSGLDVDALRVVSEGVNRYKAEENGGILLITHYTRILRYITPDRVHVFVDGRIAASGGAELADELEAHGYEKYLEHTNA